MKKSISIIIFALLISFAFAQDKPAYKLFNAQGEETSYANMINQLATADLVFFGELHNNPISHWMQFEVTKSLFEIKKTDLVLGAEMFEADNQLIMDEYLSDIIPVKKFEAEMRLWKNYKTDYKPLVEFAKENKLYFVASNIPRRYASLINKKGFEGIDELSKEAKTYISPNLVKLYDPEVKCYKEMMNMEELSNPKDTMKMPGMDQLKDTLIVKDIEQPSDTIKMAKMEMPKDTNSMAGGSHITENLLKAQAAKDATMAHFILKNRSKNNLLIHYQGAYHSDSYEGIVWWIKQLNPKLQSKTISTVLQEDVEELKEEYINRADFIFVVPESMTKTY